MLTDRKLVGGAMVILAFATAALVVLPYLQLHKLKPPDGLKPYTEQQLRGRHVYIANGCLYCHSQQPRDPAVAPDYLRGWGRAPVPADYVFDKPHLLGTMRTGPDLFNIGARQPSADWQLGHLYQPRAYVKGSIMPAFPFLFVVKPRLEAGERAVSLPPQYAPEHGVVVATDEAQDLVAYLLALNHTYPVYRDELTAHTAKREGQ
jgi:cytochrome c oxidase cbb3-type subunit 2